MTMLSFRVEDDEADAVQRWAQRLDIDRSQLLRDALHRHLVRLRAEDDVAAWQAAPLDDGDADLAAAAEWGPAEEWADWADRTDVDAAG